jgi:hypothetical protein
MFAGLAARVPFCSVLHVGTETCDMPCAALQEGIVRGENLTSVTADEAANVGKGWLILGQ